MRRTYHRITIESVVKEVLVDGKSQVSVARRRRIPEGTVNTWVLKAQRGDPGFAAQMNPHLQQKHTYAPELKKEVIHRTQRLGETMLAVARELNLPYGTVTAWVALWKRASKLQIQRPGYGHPEITLIKDGS